VNILVDGVWVSADKVTAEQLLAGILPSWDGQEGKFLRVNLDGDGYEFADAGSSFSGTMDDIANGLIYVKTENNYSSADASKLSGIGSGATANSSDATLLARANHTGTQSADTITDGTTNKAFLATERTKLGYVTVTQAVDLDDIETRVNNLDAAVVLKGSWDASAGTFPGGGLAQAGASYIVSVAGTVDSVSFALNDRIIAITDNASAATFTANWFKADYTDQVLSVVGLTGAISKANLQSAIDVSGTNTGDETGAGIRTKLGTTTIGANVNTLVNPSAVTWLRVNADNTVTARTAAQTLSDIGAQASGTYATGTGSASGTNTGDQTSIVGITGTKAQFDTACSDGNFLYVGDVTQYTAPDFPITKKVISSSQTITAAYSAICSGTMEVATGVVLEIGNGATLELT
jgi:hypothetical protein